MCVQWAYSGTIRIAVPGRACAVRSSESTVATVAALDAASGRASPSQALRFCFVALYTRKDGSSSSKNQLQTGKNEMSDVQKDTTGLVYATRENKVCYPFDPQLLNVSLT